MAESLMRLQIGNSKDFIVDSYNFSVYKPIDQSSFPTKNTQGGIINVVVYVLSGSEELSLLESWATSNSMKNGTILPQDNKFTEMIFGVSFQNAFCIHYQQSYDIAIKLTETNSPFKISLAISAQTITLVSSNSKIENQWPGVTSSSESQQNNSTTNNNLDFS